MKIAVPTYQGELCQHFGHCEKFAVIEVDESTKEIINTDFLVPPPHEPGVLPAWLHEQGANMIIAGGMGRRAQDLFASHGIQVVVGASPEKAEKVVESYLKGELVTGTNLCDH